MFVVAPAGPDRRRLSIKVLARKERAGDEEGREVAAGGPSAPYTRRAGASLMMSFNLSLVNATSCLMLLSTAASDNPCSTHTHNWGHSRTRHCVCRFLRMATHSVVARKCGSCNALQLESRPTSLWAFLTKFVLCMRRNCYFRASGKSAVRFSDPDFLKKTISWTIRRRRLSSVTFVRPTQAIEIFGNVSTPFATLATHDLSVKILPRSSQGNPSVGGVKHKRGRRI